MKFAEVETSQVHLTTNDLKRMGDLSTLLYDETDPTVYNARYQDGAIHLIFESGLNLISAIHCSTRFKCYTYQSEVKIVFDEANSSPLEIHYKDRIEYYNYKYILKKVYHIEDNILEEFDTESGVKIKEYRKDGSSVLYYNDGINKKRVYKDNKVWYYRKDGTLEMYSEKNPEDDSTKVDYYDTDGIVVILTRCR